MKIIIIEPCLVNHGDDRGGVHESAGALPDVPKDVARQLVAANRALYVSKDDDTDKGGRHTATREMLAAAEEMARAAGKPGRSRNTEA